MSQSAIMNLIMSFESNYELIVNPQVLLINRS